MHFSYKNQLTSVSITLGMMAICLGLAYVCPTPIGIKGLANYLPLHTALEFTSIVISMLVFAVGWQANNDSSPSNIVFLSCAFLGVGILDFSHTFSYAGMPDFVTPSDPEKAINFWLVARFLSATALLIVAVKPWYPFHQSGSQYVLILIGLLITAIAHWLILFHQEYLPRTFIAGQGLTPFKIACEYTLIIINLATATLLWQKMWSLQTFDVVALLGAVLVMALSEFAFTLYAEVTDIFNLLGHVFKSISYLYIYRAIFVSAVARPYRLLSDSQAKLQVTNTALQESEHLFKAIFTQAAVGLAQVDTLTNRFLWANPRYSEILGRPLDEMLAQSFLDVTHPDDVLLSMEYINQLRQGSLRSYSIEKRYVRPDQSIIWVNLTVSPLWQPGEAPSTHVAVVQDITERKLIEAQLKLHRENLQELVNQQTKELTTAKEAAEAASFAKSAFLANMSHEIRTPLNAITGMAYLLKQSGLQAKQLDQVEKLENAGQHLLGIINAVLELSKIEAGKFTLEEKPILIESLVGNVLSMMREKIAAKQLLIHTEIDIPPQGLLGDPIRIQQALLNYVNNAVKFTETGSITLRVKLIENTQDNQLIHFHVIDTGAGISPEALTRLFNAFEQADNSLTRQHGGTGLGLAITRKLAQIMGGEAGVISELGVGSSFWFTVRLKKAPLGVELDHLMTPKEAISTLKQHYAGARILLAEDEPINREITTVILENAGLIVDTAANGAIALDKFQNASYDLILMDMQMPVLDGLEATRQIRALKSGSMIPILAMTANAFAEDKQQCLAAGMNDFITKPIQVDSFYTTLLRWLSKK